MTATEKDRDILARPQWAEARGDSLVGHLAGASARITLFRA